MKIAVAAYPIDWLNRWNEYVGKLRMWVRTASEADAELIVFPELAALELASLAGEGNAGDPRRAVDALTARIKDVDDLHASLAREFDAHILAASGPLRLPEGRVFNRARLFAPDGGRGAADQVAPAPGLRDAFGLSPGAGAAAFDTELGRIGILLGADLTEPELAAALAAAGAGVLLAPAAASPDADNVLCAAASARARETGLPVALAVAIGDATWAPTLGRLAGRAAVYDGTGAETAAGKPDTPGWVHAEIAAAPAAIPLEPASVILVPLA
ncbi:nitrilase-related carbon-nitrogen hydrolase [Amaricoccus sp.]|uniref:nitrilase-related carbon-nitrogen hydrolase n=1 Tax=Amaricoccus sp. TaxID=1872485 RepID=UPI001B4B4A26|nr:nitrilase-related carbon-nitrogen hydrolase [Amaricoccus sp.]MBP7241296.1 amidohydrolase [Amaricoccus sp.]